MFNFLKKKAEITDGTYLIENVPFFSQQLTEQTYEREGFASLEEANYWAPRICGLVCLKEVINFYTQQTIPSKQLLDYGLSINAYREDVGWIHSGLVAIANHYGINGKPQSIKKNLEKIVPYLQKQNLIVASIGAGFKFGRGGHLVVVYGAAVSNNKVEKLYVHHSASTPRYEWPNYEVDREKFLKYFSKRGNIIVFSN